MSSWNRGSEERAAAAAEETSPLPSPPSTSTSSASATTTAIATLGGASVLAACWISSGAPANRPSDASVACVRANSAWMSLEWRHEAPRGAMEGDERMATRRRGGGANPAKPSAGELLEPLDADDAAADAAAARASLSAAWPDTTSCGTAAPWGIFLPLPETEGGIRFCFFLVEGERNKLSLFRFFSTSTSSSSRFSFITHGRVSPLRTLFHLSSLSFSPFSPPPVENKTRRNK